MKSIDVLQPLACFLISIIVAMDVFRSLVTPVQAQYYSSHSKARLQDIKALTFYPGKLTTARRSSPISQMACTNGPYGYYRDPVTGKNSDICSHFVPSAIRCVNDGTDGRDVQWACSADLPGDMSFGETHVSCEGWSYPDDPYILVGSCGVEYTLKQIPQPRQADPQRQPQLEPEPQYVYRAEPYTAERQYATRGPFASVEAKDMASSLVMLAIFGVLAWGIYGCCCRPQAAGDHRTGRTSPPPPQDPPPYQPPTGRDTGSSWWRNTFSDTSSTGCQPQQQQQTSSSFFPSSSFSSGPGFWTGLAAGGLLGSAFSRRDSTRRTTRTAYSPTRLYPQPQSRFFSGGSSTGFNSHVASPASVPPASSSTLAASSTTRTATGYGGTKRR